MLSHLSCEFEDDQINEDFIKLLKLNANAFILMDRDRTPNATKIRIKTEISEDNCWITEGREIENYLSKSLIDKWLSSKGLKSLTDEFSLDDKFEEVIKLQNPSLDYSTSKPKFAKEICKLMDETHLDKFNLKPRIEALLNKILIWNRED